MDFDSKFHVPVPGKWFLDPETVFQPHKTGFGIPKPKFRSEKMDLGSENGLSGLIKTIGDWKTALSG
jgi:hypothetical protein